MSKRRSMDSTGHMIGGLFTFALFGLFVLLSLLIVVIGVDGYRGVVNASDRVGELRTTLGYVAGKLRSDAASDGIRFEEVEGVQAMVLTERYEDRTFDTYIYHMDGALYELSLIAGYADFFPEDGWRLSTVADFSAELEQDNLINLKVTTADGHTQTMHVAMRAAKGASGQ